jgi:CheY-like chemotaxis protein
MKKVLIIDDNEIFAKTLIDSLPKDEYVATHAWNGSEGLDELKKDKPDIIILDLMMPKMGGLQFLEAFKKENPGRKIPILISSELSSTKDISEAVSAGIDIGVRGYIIKSTQNMDMIIRTMDSTLKESTV